MSKLYKLKDWYTVEGAAARLSATIGETVTSGDVVQLMIQEKIPVSWLLQHQPAVPVAPAQTLYIPGTVHFEIFEKLTGQQFPGTVRYIRGDVGWHAQSDRIEYLDGVHTLNLSEGGAKDFLTSWMTGAGGELYGLDGTIVVDGGGTSYQLLEHYTKEQMEHWKNKPDHYSVESCFPSSRLPEKSQAVVTREHLERFESSLVDSKERELGTRERETLYKIIIGMAVRGYSHNPGAQRSNAIADIARDLEHVGVPVSDDTVRKYIKEAAELLERKSA